MRSLLPILLLLNYLLVVGAGLRVGRPEPAFSAAHPYVHSAECQQHNYLRLDCFEHCNGERYGVQQRRPGETLLHFLAQYRGLDAHECSPAVATLPAPPPHPMPGAAARWPGAGLAPLPAGFGGRDYPPPQGA